MTFSVYVIKNHQCFLAPELEHYYTAMKFYIFQLREPTFCVQKAFSKHHKVVAKGLSRSQLSGTTAYKYTITRKDVYAASVLQLDSFVMSDVAINKRE